MKEKLVKFGNKACDVLLDVFDDDLMKFVVGAAVVIGTTSYVYNRGVKDTCTAVNALLETADKIESK